MGKRVNATSLSDFMDKAEKTNTVVILPKASEEDSYILLQSRDAKTEVTTVFMKAMATSNQTTLQNTVNQIIEDLSSNGFEAEQSAWVP